MKYQESAIIYNKIAKGLNEQALTILGVTWNYSEPEDETK